MPPEIRKGGKLTLQAPTLPNGHIQTIRRQFADELLKCVWPICGVDAQRFK